VFGTAWQEGNVLGLACDTVDKKMSFSVNGSFEPSLGVAFDNIVADYIASAFSASAFKVVAIFGTCPSRTRHSMRNTCCARCAALLSLSHILQNMKDVFKFGVLALPSNQGQKLELVPVSFFLELNPFILDPLTLNPLIFHEVNKYDAAIRSGDS
jgi:hypothetical protein